MNELQRQAYLSALGIENYAPRWLLPAAPVSAPCVMPVLPDFAPLAASAAHVVPAQAVDYRNADSASPAELLNTIAEFKEEPKKAPLAVNAAAILQQLEEKKAAIVKPFSLSVYRPKDGFLIIDSRNTTLALPTELLLNNILRAVLNTAQFSLAEEVLRWPMIENRFVSRTEDDARNELQTWLAVENELRPVQTLWLMGEDAARYWLTPDSDWLTACWTGQSLKDIPLQALILPSLNQLLQNPQQKARLWMALPYPFPH